ncbi:Formamidopyrimidine-DNA glycosylase, partial [Linum perenne]
AFTLSISHKFVHHHTSLAVRRRAKTLTLPIHWRNMPELPEVEAARRALEEHCLGKIIKKAIVADDSKVIDGVSSSDLQSALVGKTIVATLRKGKNMWLKLDSPPFPSFQFGMTGAVYIKGVAVTESAVKDTDEWPSKFSKLFVELDDGVEFSFTDKRRLAKIRLLDDPASVPPISQLGPDALLQPMTVDELQKALSKKKVGIKSLLLDQARIHPHQSSSSLSKECCETLQKCIKQVVEYAVEVDAVSSCFPLQWLFHFRWGKKAGEVIEQAIKVGTDSSQFPKNWLFHFREKKPGKAFVDGKTIEFTTTGGRTTAYVPELQKLTGDQTGKEQSKSQEKALKRKKGKNYDGEMGSGGEEEEASLRARPKRGSNAKETKAGKNKIADDDDDDDDDDSDEDVDSTEDQNKKPGNISDRKQTKAGKASKGKVKKSKKKAV